MPAPKRYFDNESSAGASPAKRLRGDGPSQRGGRGRGRGAGGRGRGDGRGGHGGQRGPPREKKEPFKPKDGFISAGLKAYTDAATEARDKSDDAVDTDAASHQTTLYLTHLPPSLTSPQLTLIFSSYAPLRAAFVVSSNSSFTSAPAPDFGGSSANAISLKAGRDRTGKSTSRGFGYVRFVLRSDAEQCLAEWGTKEGIPRSLVSELEGQEGLAGVEWDKVCGPGGIKVQWAKKKLKEGEKPEGADKNWKIKGKAPASAAPQLKEDDEVAQEETKTKWRPDVWDHNASRTVVVLGLPLPGEAGSTEEAAEGDEQDGDEEKMDVDAQADSSTGSTTKKGKHIDWKKALRQRAKKIGDVEDVLFPVKMASGEQAALVVMYTPRHAHDLMSKLNNHVFRGVLVSAAVKSSWDLCQRLGRSKGGGRLLVRNLGFDITVPDLRAAFARFGPIHSIILPVNPSTSKPRGFAFVYFVTRSHAENALKALNGTRIYAGMAAERIASEGGKEGKKKEVREKKKAEKEKSGGGGGEKGRVVAVDWALSKEEWQKAQEAEAGGEAAEDSATAGEEDGDESASSDEDEEDEDEDSDMSPVPEDLEQDSDMSPEPVGAEHEEVDDEEDEEKDAQEDQQNATLFVRNMSFEATEAELYDLFKQFGPVRYARVVFDPVTKRSRGTAFVCFWNKEHAQAVLAESEALNKGTSTKKTTLLMADPTSSSASRLTLHGRVLAAVPAVSKGQADKLREDRDKKGGAKTDRRNLYLMREGVIFPTWAIAKTLSAADMDARQSSFDARKGLLRSNPSLYISRTRLSIRQIPLYVSDGMLKRLANHAIREFERDVKAGLQKPLTEEELITFVPDASGAKEPTWNKVERKKGIPLGKVRQSKILRQNDRVDALTGLGRSKGYGFLELGTHADALRVLRWANANKEVNRLFRVWWREELDKMVDSVEKGEGKLGKGLKVGEKEDRLKRLQEKRKELEEEENLAKEKEAKREAQGKSLTGEAGRSSKCLIIEFSIENAVTTKRRAEKAERAREKARRAKERGGEMSEDEEEAEDANEVASTASPKKMDGKRAKGKKGGKKRKADDGESESASPKKKRAKADAVGDEDKPAKEGARIGSLIGRKRKMKKGKK
ncbi:ribosomal processing [Rhodotorula toruloides]|uniref:Ribosomal processing n=1 Tax=Rhodotorula toruloides TaxID=5286 RepID=A0A511KIM2_RHOTO|nr:ribosomal processing [Rhodotorula toruloides]